MVQQALGSDIALIAKFGYYFRTHANKWDFLCVLSDSVLKEGDYERNLQGHPHFRDFDSFEPGDACLWPDL